MTLYTRVLLMGQQVWPKTSARQSDNHSSSLQVAFENHLLRPAIFSETYSPLPAANLPFTESLSSGERQTYDLAMSLPHGFPIRSPIRIHGHTHVAMSHQSLLNSHRRAQGIQPTAMRVPEHVGADVTDLRPTCCLSQRLPNAAIGHWQSPNLYQGCEQPNL
jgi:hypothetical protein